MAVIFAFQKPSRRLSLRARPALGSVLSNTQPSAERCSPAALLCHVQMLNLVLKNLLLVQPIACWKLTSRSAD